MRMHKRDLVIDHDTLRELTPTEQAQAATLTPWFGRWFGLWIDRGWRFDEVCEWWPATRWRTKLPNDAARLRAAGWRPADVIAALGGGMVLNPLAAMWDIADATSPYSWSMAGAWVMADVVQWPGDTLRDRAGAVLAYAVLADYVATYRDCQADLARSERSRLLAAAVHEGTAPVTLAVALGVTKQRLHAMRTAQR